MLSKLHCYAQVCYACLSQRQTLRLNVCLYKDITPPRITGENIESEAVTTRDPILKGPPLLQCLVQSMNMFIAGTKTWRQGRWFG